MNNKPNIEEIIYSTLEGEKPGYSVLFKAHAELDNQNVKKKTSDGQNFKKPRIKRRHIFALATSFSIVLMLAISLPFGIIHGTNFGGIGCASIAGDSSRTESQSPPNDNSVGETDNGNQSENDDASNEEP